MGAERHLSLDRRTCVGFIFFVYLRKWGATWGKHFKYFKDLKWFYVKQDIAGKVLSTFRLVSTAVVMG